jgi:RNA polymerase sigma-70 factor, ECF subfamily
MENESELSDALLMGRLATGDGECVGALIRRHGRALLAFLRRTAPTAADADDVFQEVWLRVVRSAHAYDPQQRFTAWLFTIAWNQLRDHWRRQKAEPSVADDRDIGASEAPSPRPGAEVQLIEAERRAHLRQLIALLPERMAEAIWLRYVDELSEKEMAARLGVPVGTVKSRLHHGMKRLEPLVKDEA